VIGKDITRFHAIYWPAFLLSAGLPVPEQVVVHGFLFSRGEKMSKSVGNVVSPSDLVRTYGVDQTRYFFLREVPFGQDGNYSHEAIVNRINADLANDLGNLAQRSLSMIAKNCGGVVPDCGPLSDAEREILAAADAIHAEARAAHENHAINKALDSIWRVVADANRYFAAQEPWALKKTDPSRMATVLYVTADVLRIIGIMSQPYIPSSAAPLLQLLGMENHARSFAELGNRLVSGTPLPAPQPIFPRYIEEEAAKV
jgi:methionyl-tRNA synthetase